jgi:hypothetical protein
MDWVIEQEMSRWYLSFFYLLSRNSFLATKPTASATLLL